VSFLVKKAVGLVDLLLENANLQEVSDREDLALSHVRAARAY
jgi:hypothetical protein